MCVWRSTDQGMGGLNVSAVAEKRRRQVGMQVREGSSGQWPGARWEKGYARLVQLPTAAGVTASNNLERLGFGEDLLRLLLLCCRSCLLLT